MICAPFVHLLMLNLPHAPPGYSPLKRLGLLEGAESRSDQDQKE